MRIKFLRHYKLSYPNNFQTGSEDTISNLSTCTTLTNSSLVTNEEAAISDIGSADSLISFVNDTTNSQNNNDGNIIAAATFEPDKFIFINSIAE
ncbi:unnamed protein product, partial [Tenebrio molitor]